MSPDLNRPSLLQALVSRLDRPITTADRRRAARHLLDWLACRAAATRLPEAGRFNQALGDGPVAMTAAPAALDEARPQLAAVLMDGALGSLLEMDDVHRAAVLHPGPVVIPAALAAARGSGADVTRLLNAIICGYEVMIRIGRAVGLEHYRHWHPTSTCGAFGAAAAAAVVLGLDAERAVWALGNAGSRTGGLWQMRHEAVPTKALHTALTAQSGWLAARLAAEGFAGPASLLEGEQGFFAATAAQADPNALLGAEDAWLIHQVSFKPWPACRHAHPAIDALLAVEELPEADSVERITVHTYAAAIDFCDQPEPGTPGEARFSIQHALASILTRGRPRLAHYSADALPVAATRALRRRIMLHVDSDFNQAFPDHFGARVEVALADGRRLSAGVRDAWGDPERPLTDADLATKVHDLLQFAGVSGEQSSRMVEYSLALAEQGSAAAIPALQQAWT